MSTTFHHNCRPMRFAELDTGCFVCVSHCTGVKGYLRKKWVVAGVRVAEPFHRFIYKAHHGLSDIPVELEVDHICRNRACCNPKHLRLLDRSDHKRVTNTMRSDARIEEALCYWLSQVTVGLKCTGQALADRFNVSQATGNRWIRVWLQDDDVLEWIPKTAKLRSGRF